MLNRRIHLLSALLGIGMLVLLYLMSAAPVHIWAQTNCTALLIILNVQPYKQLFPLKYKARLNTGSTMTASTP